jgi:hypothetical protein
MKSRWMTSRLLSYAVVLLTGLAWLIGPVASACATEENGASWRLEPIVPPPVAGLPEATTPIGLGKIGDVEFWAPNRGLLITAGNPPTVPPGVWAYNGVSWHELATVCGATDGRIGWAGPEEFWTVSDGRPGQALTEGSPPPLADNTLCHFSAGAVVGSYASLAFRPSSYQVMHGVGCLSSSDCWFAGDILPLGQVGSFHLHWDGSSLTAEPNPQGRAVLDLRKFGRRLYESVRLTESDVIVPPESGIEPSVLHTIAPSGVSPTFTLLHPESEIGQSLPVYGPEAFPTALDYLRLGADEESLWVAADPTSPTPEGSAPGEVTILRQTEGVWSQILGPGSDPLGGNPFTKYLTKEHEQSNELVRSIAPEPGSEAAWLALDTKGDAERPSPLAHAIVARISADGTVSEAQTLPSPAEEANGIGPKGGSERIVCPAQNDCWLTTTQGWMFHLSDEGHRHLSQDNDPAFAGLITYRPLDQGIPAIVPDAPPVDDSGLPGEQSAASSEPPTRPPETRIPVALLTHMHARLVHGTTLELSFHLAVKARLRLVAKRKARVVASTPRLTFKAGNRKLLLSLDRRRWPTKLDLQSHALAPLPTVSTRSSGVGAVSTRAAFRAVFGALDGWRALP